MTDEKLAEGVRLQAEITKTKRVLERLNEPGLIVQLHTLFSSSAFGSTLIDAVGAGEKSDHELAPMAQQFVARVLRFYETRLQHQLQLYAQL